MVRRVRWPGLAVQAALVMLLAAPGVRAQTGEGEGGSTPEPAAELEAPTDAPDEEPAPPRYWVLEEFDWGDDEEVVAESIDFDPNFFCNGDADNPCLIVTTEAPGENLLARFDHHEGELWQVRIGTPSLDAPSARRHLGRVQRLLAGYASERLGEPALALPLPDLDVLGFGVPQVTHFWSAPGLEARVVVGRRDLDLFYVTLLFSDPVRGVAAREAWEAKIVAKDERERARRARAKQREAERKRGGAAR